MKFSIRIANVELRSCDEYLDSGNIHDRAEIVKWSKNDSGKPYCQTVAYWEKHDQYNLKFVGNKPFDIDTTIFMRLAKIGQELLNDFL